MIIFPAIDIKDGCCVRLVKGEFSTVHKVAEDPLETAAAFKKAGATYLHTVDLDGAKDATMANRDLICEIAGSSGLRVDVGGGIRSLDAAEYYLSRGLNQVILGSVALKNPALCQAAVKAFGHRIVVGIDAKNGLVATEGWLEESQVNYLDLAREMAKMGVETIVFTDIAKDGTLTGPNFDQLGDLQKAVPCKLVASGGISNLADIQRLTAMGLYGAICGKSLYSGSLDLAAAIKAGAAYAE